MKLYTKNGDDGSTGLIGNVRVAKCDPRVDAYGEVDETNAAIGLVIADCADKPIAANLQRIQADLVMLGAELATPADQVRQWTIRESHVAALEKQIDEARFRSRPGEEPVEQFGGLRPDAGQCGDATEDGIEQRGTHEGSVQLADAERVI